MKELIDSSLPEDEAQELAALLAHVAAQPGQCEGYIRLNCEFGRAFADHAIWRGWLRCDTAFVLHLTGHGRALLQRIKEHQS